MTSSSRAVRPGSPNSHNMTSAIAGSSGTGANAIGAEENHLFQLSGYISSTWRVKRVEAVSADAAMKSANDDGMKVVACKIAKPMRAHARAK